MTIRYELEKYQSPEAGKDFMTITLTGDTFTAKDVIKSLGDFQFSDQVGRGKAWRSKTFLVANAATDKTEIVAIVNKMYNALKAAGYTVVRQ